MKSTDQTSPGTEDEHIAAANSRGLRTFAAIRSTLGDVAVIGLRDYSARRGDELVLRTEAQAEIDRLNARVAELEKDAARYRVIRSAGSLLKIYIYEDENDSCSGDWLYKPRPEAVDQWADAALTQGDQDGR